MASTGSALDNLEGGSSAADPLQALVERIEVTASLINLASSCHALRDGEFSRTQATEGVPAQQVLLEAIEARRTERLRLIATKVGCDPAERLHSEGHIDWSRCNLDAVDVRCLAGLCARQPAAVRAETLRIDVDEDEDEDEDGEVDEGMGLLPRQLFNADNVDLSQRGIGVLGAVFVATAVKFSAVLRSLDLSSNYIDAEGAKALADALASGSAVLNSLSLGGNDIRPTGATAIAEALKSGSSVLKSIDLSWNNLRTEGAIAIADALKSGMAVLDTLSLAHNDIGSTGATAIAEALKSGSSVLTECNVRGNNLDRESANALAKVATEKRVMLFGIKHDQTHIDYRRQDLGPVDAILIASDLRVSAVLTNLSVAYNLSISGEAVQQLSAAALSSKSLEVFSEVPIKDLREDKLAELDLSGKGLGQTEAIVIAALIEGSAVLSSLNLSQNRISSTGASAIAEALKLGSSVLTNLSVAYNPIAGEAAEQLAAAALGSTSLEVFSEVPIKGLREDKHTSLDLSQKDLGPTEGIVLAQLVKGSAVLNSLSLGGNDIGPTGATAIAEALKSGSSVLRSLDLRCNGIGADGAKALADALASARAVLSSLDLSSNGIGWTGATAIAEALKSGSAVLTNFSVAYNPSISGEAAQQLSAAVLSSKSLEVFSQVPMKDLREDKLTELDLSRRGLGPTEAIVIAALIEGSSVLTKIDLQFNGLDDDAKRRLTDANNQRRTPLKLQL